MDKSKLRRANTKINILIHRETDPDAREDLFIARRFLHQSYHDLRLEPNNEVAIFQFRLLCNWINQTIQTVLHGNHTDNNLEIYKKILIFLDYSHY